MDIVFYSSKQINIFSYQLKLVFSMQNARKGYKNINGKNVMILIISMNMSVCLILQINRQRYQATIHRLFYEL